MKWLPEVWSITNPLCSRKRMTWRGLRAGSFGIIVFSTIQITEKAEFLAGILEIQGGDQRFVVARDGVFVLSQAGDVAGDGVFGHFAGFVHRAAIRDATGKCGNEGGVAAFGFGPEHDVVVVACLRHKGSRSF